MLFNSVKAFVWSVINAGYETLIHSTTRVLFKFLEWEWIHEMIKTCRSDLRLAFDIATVWSVVVLTMKQPGTSFQNAFLFLKLFPIHVVFLFETGPIQWIFNQHCGYSWPITLALGLRQLQCCIMFCIFHIRYYIYRQWLSRGNVFVLHEIKIVAVTGWKIEINVKKNHKSINYETQCNIKLPISTWLCPLGMANQLMHSIFLTKLERDTSIAQYQSLLRTFVICFQMPSWSRTNGLSWSS